MFTQWKKSYRADAFFLYNEGSTHLLRRYIIAAARDRDEVCAVCQEPLMDDEKCEVLGCGHVFHTACAHAWIAVAPHCPICRAVTDPL